jgi:hypothetical protein
MGFGVNAFRALKMASLKPQNGAKARAVGAAERHKMMKVKKEFFH